MGSSDGIDYQSVFSRHLGDPLYSLYYSMPDKCTGKKSPKCIKGIGIDLDGNDIIDPDEKLDVNQDGKLNERDYQQFYTKNSSLLRSKTSLDNQYWKLVLDIESRKACLRAPAAAGLISNINDLFTDNSPKNINKRITATRRIGEAATDCALPALVAALDDQISDVRSAAAEALIKKGEKAIPFLLEGIKGLTPANFSPLCGDKPELIIRGIFIKIGKPVLPYLKKALEDPTFKNYYGVINDLISQIKNECKQ